MQYPGCSMSSDKKVAASSPRSPRHHRAGSHCPPPGRDPSLIPGGYQMTYTGALRWTPAQQKASVARLSKCDPDKVPDSKRIAPESRRANELVSSYQWNAGGQTIHGFKY